MARRSARERIENARRLSPVAAGVFVFCGIVLQVAILWSGYWDAAPARTAIPVRPVTPVAVPERARTQPAARGLGSGDIRSLEPDGPAGADAPSAGPRDTPETDRDDRIDGPATRPGGRGPVDPVPGGRPATPGATFGRA